MVSTKGIVKFLGDLIFFLQLIGIPLLIFQFYYQGDSVGNWFDGLQWYTMGLYCIGIIGVVAFYLWIQFHVKMRLDVVWLKIAANYDGKLAELDKIKEGYFPTRKTKKEKRTEKDLKRQEHNKPKKDDESDIKKDWKKTNIKIE